MKANIVFWDLGFNWNWFYLLFAAAGVVMFLAFVFFPTSGSELSVNAAVAPSERVCELAESLVDARASETVKMNSLTRWVKENVAYDFNDSTARFWTYSASELLERKRGVCRDDSVLLCSFAECLNISCESKTIRFAFNDKWMAHSVARVVVDGSVLYCDSVNDFVCRFAWSIDGN